MTPTLKHVEKVIDDPTSQEQADAAEFIEHRLAITRTGPTKADLDDAANWARLLELGRQMSSQLSPGQSFGEILDEMRR